MNENSPAEHVTAPKPTLPQSQPYVPPALKPLGQWSSVTLLITVPVGPGGYLRPGSGEQQV